MHAGDADRADVAGVGGVSFRFSDKERSRLKNVSDAESEAETRALTDPENPPLTKQQLDGMALAREVRLVRQRTGLSQPQFAPSMANS